MLRPELSAITKSKRLKPEKLTLNFFILLLSIQNFISNDG